MKHDELAAVVINLFILPVSRPLYHFPTIALSPVNNILRTRTIIGQCCPYYSLNQAGTRHQHRAGVHANVPHQEI